MGPGLILQAEQGLSHLPWDGRSQILQLPHIPVLCPFCLQSRKPGGIQNHPAGICRQRTWGDARPHSSPQQTSASLLLISFLHRQQALGAGLPLPCSVFPALEQYIHRCGLPEERLPTGHGHCFQPPWVIFRATHSGFHKRRGRSSSLNPEAASSPVA